MKAEGCGPEARAALEESRQRVYPIALVHEHLCDSARLDRIDFAEYARELVRGVRGAFEDGRAIELILAIDPIQLGIDRAVPCALILNELLSSAFKYAFAGRSGGRIVLSFPATAD